MTGDQLVVEGDLMVSEPRKLDQRRTEVLRWNIDWLCGRLRGRKELRRADDAHDEQRVNQSREDHSTSCPLRSAALMGATAVTPSMKARVSPALNTPEMRTFPAAASPMAIGLRV